MKSIKIYNTNEEYQINKVTLPTAHVAYSKDGILHYGGKKKASGVITEEEYGSDVFDIFKAQGWIDQNATYMTSGQAASITALGTAFYQNTEITDATFLRYFKGLTDWGSGFQDCTNLKRIVIPTNITSTTVNLVANCSLEYAEILEGVTNMGSRFLKGGGNDSSGCLVKFPSTLTTISGFSNVKGEDNIIDLRDTNITSITSSSMYTLSNVEKVYLPETLTSIGDDVMQAVRAIKYIEYNSNVSLTIGGNGFARNPSYTPSNIVVNFKNNIPLTIGTAFAFAASGTNYCIFHSTTPPTIGTNFFSRSGANSSIFVPEGCVSAYEAVANLSRFVGKTYEIGGTEWTNAGLDQYE